MNEAELHLNKVSFNQLSPARVVKFDLIKVDEGLIEINDVSLSHMEFDTNHRPFTITTKKSCDVKKLTAVDIKGDKS